jgi:metal-responsive CopG/Arc/MetJ family transcriptional regulator
MKRDDSGTRVRRVTVSLPADLFAWGEKERARRKVSRSAFVADLYRRQLEELEKEQRVARYAAAYGKQPETEEERAWAEGSAHALAGLYADE